MALAKPSRRSSKFDAANEGRPICERFCISWNTPETLRTRVFTTGSEYCSITAPSCAGPSRPSSPTSASARALTDDDDAISDMPAVPARTSKRPSTRGGRSMPERPAATSSTPWAPVNRPPSFCGRTMWYSSARVTLKESSECEARCRSHRPSEPPA